MILYFKNNHLLVLKVKLNNQHIFNPKEAILLLVLKVRF